MLETHILTPENVDRIEARYNAFRAVAMAEYDWHDEPVDFETLKPNIVEGYLQGLFIEEPGEDDPVMGFMLYVPEQHRAIEVNVVYIPHELEWKTILDTMLRAFLKDIRFKKGWDTVSWAMLGIQERFVLTSHWYGLKPVGQTIQKFDLMNELSLPVLGKVNQVMPSLPEGYELTTWEGKGQDQFKKPYHWDPDYRDQVAESIFQAFEASSDALWDPRFRSLTGAHRVVGLLGGNQMGLLVPEATSVLLEVDTESGKKEAVGFCYLVQTDVHKANIPLIGIRPSVRHKGLGKQVLRHALMSMVRGIMAGELMIGEVTATVDTDNYFALKMYRALGFQETTNYPHCYATPDTIRGSYYGRSIFGATVPTA